MNPQPLGLKPSALRQNCTLVIGLDGATFDVLNPLIASGDMPALGSLIERSAHGPLFSTIPPTTPPAWTTCTTGLNPGKHGIFDFTVSPLKNPDRPLISSADIKAPRIWNVVESSGGRSIVVNVPITWPPQQLNGCMVSGMMTPGFHSPFTWPPDLRDRLKAVCGNYVINIDIPRYDTATETDIRRFLGDLRESVDRRREAVRYLMDTEQWTFFMVVFVALDRIQHLFAAYLFPDNPLYDTPKARRLRPDLIALFRLIDTVIGELISKLRDNDLICILSDHGFGVTDGFFNVNTWLHQQHLLSLRTAAKWKKKAFHTLHTIGDSSVVQTMIPQSIQSVVRKSIRSRRSTLHSPVKDLATVVNWPNTKAFFASIPTQGIYINEITPDNPNGTVSADQIEPLRQQIKTGLESLKHPKTGLPLTDKVWFREELYHGPETVFAPHILFKMRNYAVLGRQHIGSANIVSDTGKVPAGFHRSDGILIIAGNAVQSGPVQANMADIMPTLLYGMGLPIPDNLDGTIVSSIYTDDFRSNNPIQYQSFESNKGDAVSASQRDGNSRNTGLSDEEHKAVEKRLQDLGYLS